ncbi:MAG: hypothetical protein FWE02_05405 [Defluviitaleaceae bacterium]|nr:hypothetical protein [Defluviitaleaceae bacterium]
MYNLKKYLTATLAGLMALGTTTPLIAAPTASDSTESLNYSSEYDIHPLILDPRINNIETVKEMPTVEFVTEYEIDRFDSYVILENGEFTISEEGFLSLTENELYRLRNILLERNQTASILIQNMPFHVFTEDSIVLIDTLSLFRNPGGVTRVDTFWWGLRVYLSANVVNTLGAGIAIGGIWVPHPVVSRALGTIGVLGTTVSRGIWFEVAVFDGLPVNALIRAVSGRPQAGWQ